MGIRPYERKSSDMNEQAILDRLLARDETALEAIRETWGRPALALARRIMGSAEDAEECLQDGLLAVWETVPPQRPEALGHYFTALVRNAALNRWRDARRQKRGGGTVPLALEELEFCASARDDVEEAVAARLLGERIKIEDHFLAGTELYRDKTVSDLDFNRLLRFLTDLHSAEETELGVYVERINDLPPLKD